MDSRTSYHIINDFNNLSIKGEYTSSDQLTIANGNGLAISHLSSITLSTAPTPLKLSTMLYVPSVTDNLIFVFQLYNHKNVFIEFLPLHFEIKSLSTRETLLRGSNDNYVYKLFNSFIPTTPQATTITIPSTLQQWHHRLGHPATHFIIHLKPFVENQ
ncbi:hypothetical protein NMG60_11029439 [Bertholletia excelsa]